MEIRLPESMREEHEALHNELLRLTDIPGSVGVAAREVARVLHESSPCTQRTRRRSPTPPPS